LGLDLSAYETTFEHQRLPLGAAFTHEAIEFMRNNNGFVEYYHNYNKEEPHLLNFREMISQRLRLGEIIQQEGLCS
jgi:hypothetical protein